MKRNLKILLARPRGFCAGVVRAIDVVNKAIDRYGAPIYVRHEIVHNRRVVETLRQRGAVFVKELDEIPTGGVTIFSAHGVAEAIETDASQRGLPVIDATCPLVSKVHAEGRRHASQGLEVIMIGHNGHPEVEGTRGRIPGGVQVVSSVEDVSNLNVKDPQKLAFVTQTTLSVDDTRDIISMLRARFPAIEGPDLNDICYATQNRQSSVRDLCEKIDLLLVVGAKNSSNSNRLKEIGTEMKIKSYLIDDANAFDEKWLEGIETIGITAGASAPEELISELLEKLAGLGETTVDEISDLVENIQFKLPKALSAP
ncbi:MAG: 4-hydroxy-3-methylbut-2-enyl diphosphate reductase [Rhodospirillaceae bacterium]|jgi:4-hydroxy-3-methylbut-2-en-1-yl diphosphate reductase|nr:4-hydroxy-3-methylbut-2-enyl diphosphate reductase [Rhodospirillaceae bacterium]MBT5243237.1 4-hydroxy-3-methylbut-2-enyl diphosphate reductase [Rhodospirillaceae bacterium]MBT5563979.1 4-hydroxy-3-methylbut-2-enyl diphosphate reductase [Rhodospirillaceae bacterium]MBT6240817.1 4-hydroxy-3-methylbut-2-enyl diphosphate reductase [Rhodospirillaceae bacterium]MBT7136619.1 4-hydroxy-3-methylbut-2-enyl diphosphate reductase [Rhodospirillaceae bacterium]